jgi:hypothetical protein
VIDTTRMKARPERIRVRLWDPGPPGVIPLELPARAMWPVGLVFGAFFAIFAAVEWAAIAKISWGSVHGIADLVFVLFQVFWVLGWSVGVLILGALTILFFFYGESARLQDRTLVHVPRLGPINVLVDYDLAKVRNVRLENADAGAVRVRFDYDAGTNTLGDTMPRADGQRLVDAIATAASAVAPMPMTAEIVAPPPPVEVPVEFEPAPPLWSISGVALVAANMVPLVGVLLFGWDLPAIMVLFWAESAVIAFYTILKMVLVGKLFALLAVPFFIGHFGAFMAMHFLFIYAFFLHGLGAGPEPAFGEVLRSVFVPLWAPIAALFISHGISFFTNFLGRRENAGASLSKLMHAPYSRIMVMQVTLIFGGWIVLLLKTPIGALVLLVAMKTAADFWSHRKERMKARTPA